MVVCSKSCKFWPNRWVLVLFHETRHFLQPFPEKFIGTHKHGTLFEKVASFGPIDDFEFSQKTRHFLQLFAEKFTKASKHGSLLEKLRVFAKIDDFSCFFTKWGTFWNFFLKSSSKCKDMVVCSKSCKVLVKSMIFRAFPWIELLFATFCLNVHRNTKTW